MESGWVTWLELLLLQKSSKIPRNQLLSLSLEELQKCQQLLEYRANTFLEKLAVGCRRIVGTVTSEIA
jgi:hypothetical protein